MRWDKRGLIVAPDALPAWGRLAALQPTPLLLSGRVIRLYLGFRDAAGVGRVGFVDVDAADPRRVLRVADRPALDVGVPGAFDDNGVVPSAVVRCGEEVYLHYAGYQLGVKVRFTVFGGLAVSRDGGETFTRHTATPVLDRTDRELFFRVAHTVRREGDVWKVWYGGGSAWVAGDGKQLPVYDIRYLESHDGKTFSGPGRVCLENSGPDEHRVARPYVLFHDGRYKMFYSVGTKSKTYRLGYAESPDGLTWTRLDDRAGIDISDGGWDSRMMAYSSVVLYKDTAYLFYNGNNYGETGVGFAQLGEW